MIDEDRAQIKLNNLYGEFSLNQRIAMALYSEILKRNSEGKIKMTGGGIVVGDLVIRGRYTKITNSTIVNFWESNDAFEQECGFGSALCVGISSLKDWERIYYFKFWAENKFQEMVSKGQVPFFKIEPMDSYYSAKSLADILDEEDFVKERTQQHPRREHYRGYAEHCRHYARLNEMTREIGFDEERVNLPLSRNL